MPIILAPLSGGGGGGGGGVGAGSNPDVFRIVTRTAGGGITPLFDLNEGTNYVRERGTFKFTPAPPQAQVSNSARRYGGAQTVGVTHANATIAWTAILRGDTQQESADLLELLLAEVENEARERLIEWRPPGVTASSFLRLMGPGTWDPDYQWHQWTGTPGFMRVVINFPVHPLVEWAPMAIGDSFDSDTLADYTFDAGTAASITTGTLNAYVPNGALTTMRRTRHTARGYTHTRGWATVMATPGTTITGYRAGVQMNATATTGIDVYVSDNGTNSSLNIDVNVGAGWVNRSTRNLVSRVSDGVPFWVRARIEGGKVYAEHWSVVPLPMSTTGLANFTPQSAGVATGYTLTAPELALSGNVGWTWTPQHALALLNDFLFQPYATRNTTLPAVFQIESVPGNAPAKAEVSITPVGPGASPWALMAWAPTPSLIGTAPFGIFEGENASDLSGWTIASNASAHNGQLLNLATGGAATTTASWTVNPSLFPTDAFTEDEVTLEVWARFSIAQTVVTPKLTFSVRPVDGLSFGAERFTSEYGAAGKTVIAPTGGFLVTRLGVVTVTADALRARTVKLWVGGSVAAGSTGSFGLDYIAVNLARARALGPTAKAFDSAYPAFVSSGSETTKLIRSDLSGAVSKPPNTAYPDHGLGGSLLEFPPGPTSLYLTISSQVPDDPGAALLSGEVSTSAATDVAITPRSFMLRSS